MPLQGDGQTMKLQIIGWLVTVSIAAGIVFYVTDSRKVADPADLVDALVDTGLQFSTNRTDTDLLQQRLKRFWKDHSRLPAKWINSRKEKTYFFGAQEALKMGVVDRIITNDHLPNGGNDN